MWTREELKTKAKSVLKINYWKSFLVSMVLLAAGSRSGGGGGAGGSGGRGGDSAKYDFGDGSFMNFFQENSVMITMVIFIVIIIMLMVLLFRIFIGYALEVGCRKFFVQSASGTTDLALIGYGFGSGRYGGILKSMLLQNVYLFLWTLLLIVPGIIKGYSYRMVPYILADNPDIGPSRAIELSRQMMDGEKWNVFVLDLSFIGWYLLGLLALVIGTLFVRPYDDATNAQLYMVLRWDAIDRGLTTYDELRLENVNDVF